MHLHHVLPELNREAIAGVTIPGNLRDLQAHAPGVKDGSAEEQGGWNLSCIQSMDVLGDGYVEVEGARDGHIDEGCAVECRDIDDHVRPQQRMQGLAPT